MTGGTGEADYAVRARRLTTQHLAPGSGFSTPADAVRHLVAVQAQLPSAAALAVRVRTRGTTADAVHASIGAGDLVRTWALRGTLHLLAAEDVDWLLALLGPVALAGGRRRRAQLGLDARTLDASLAVLAQLLAAGPRTRRELFAGLASAGIDPAGQRGIHVVQHAALRGLLCFGPDRGREPTWVRRPDPTSDPPDREEALTRLAQRYRSGYASVDPHDLAAWSGLSVSDARLAGRLAEDAGHAGKPARPGRGRRPVVRMLGHFDPYLTGYAGRALVVPAGFERTVWTGGGYVVPTVVVDGRAVATWRWKRRGRRLEIAVDAFGPAGLDEAVRLGIDREVADVGRFLRVDATWA